MGTIVEISGSFSLPAKIAFVLALTSLVWVGFFVPESLHVTALSDIVETNENPAGVTPGQIGGAPVDESRQQTYGATASGSSSASTTTPSSPLLLSTSSTPKPIPESSQSSPTDMEVSPESSVSAAEDSKHGDIAKFFILWRDTVMSVQILTDGPILPVAISLFLLMFNSGGTIAYILPFLALRFGWGAQDQGNFLLALALYRIFYLMVVLPGLFYWFETSRMCRPLNAAESTEAETAPLLTGFSARSTEEGEQERVLDSAAEKTGGRTVYERTTFEMRLLTVAFLCYGAGFSMLYFVTDGRLLIPYMATVNTLPGVSILTSAVTAAVAIFLVQTIDRHGLARRIEATMWADRVAAARVEEEVLLSDDTETADPALLQKS
ncbi:hypothetical protein HDU96_002201 [Phlyctochytrium bullatum]|nr:hypothetical protein HDU96_002201 [Phlyctochytrium bullatum]